MTGLIPVAVAALAGVYFSIQAAKAQAADSVYWDCRYSSFAQCRPNVLTGNRGFCNVNPYFAYQPADRRGHWKKH
jgi:hypothetical protein